MENLDHGPLDHLYERGWLHDAEDREEYRPGGFHPVHIGDKFGKGGRYRVIHKLGRGGSSTVWLCRDQDTQKYVALKIVIANKSHEKSLKLQLRNRKGLDFSEPGGEYIIVPHEHFWHDGPNGRHLCLVFPVRGPRVTSLWQRGKFEDPAKVSRDIVLQVTQGLHFLHRKEICHGDLRPSNILFNLKGLDELSEDELMRQLGEPEEEPLLTISGESAAPSGPEYIVESLNLDQLDPRFISNQISIIDFGDAYDMRNPPKELEIQASFRSPELLLSNIIGVGCDLWALGCTIFEIRAGHPLFENFMEDEDHDIIMQMVPLLGKLPEPWWSSWKARSHWYEEDGTPLFDPETGKPFVLTDTLEELLSSSLQSCDELEGKSEAGGKSVHAEESEYLGHLLRELMKYNPEERLSAEDVLEHYWFKFRS